MASARDFVSVLEHSGCDLQVSAKCIKLVVELLTHRPLTRRYPSNIHCSQSSWHGDDSKLTINVYALVITPFAESV